MEFTMQAEHLDDDSIAVNFDSVDHESGQVDTGGYLMVRDEDGYIIATMFDKDGNVVFEYATEKTRLV